MKFLFRVKSVGAKRLSRFCGVMAPIAFFVWVFISDGVPTVQEFMKHWAPALAVSIVLYAITACFVLAIAWVIEGFKQKPPN